MDFYDCYGSDIDGVSVLETVSNIQYINAVRKESGSGTISKGELRKCATYYACRGFHLDVLEFLVEYCERYSVPNVVLESPPSVRSRGVCLASGRVPKYHTLLHEVTMRSTSMLQGVSLTAINNMVQYLMTHTSLVYELNVQDSYNGYTILHYAITNKNVELVKYLLEYNDVDTAAVSDFSETAYDCCVQAVVLQCLQA